MNPDVKLLNQLFKAEKTASDLAGCTLDTDKAHYKKIAQAFRPLIQAHALYLVELHKKL